MTSAELRAVCSLTNKREETWKRGVISRKELNKISTKKTRWSIDDARNNWTTQRRMKYWNKSVWLIARYSLAVDFFACQLLIAVFWSRLLIDCAKPQTSALTKTNCFIDWWWPSRKTKTPADDYSIVVVIHCGYSIVVMIVITVYILWQDCWMK